MLSAKNRVVRSGAERTGLLRKAFQACAPMNVWLSNAGTQFCEECSPAQPVGGFRACMAVRDGGPLVLGELAAPPVNSSLSAFSFVPCPARFLFGKTKRKCGGHSDGQSPSSGGKAAHRYMPTVTAIRFPALTGRQPCRFLESGPLHPPQAALGPLEHRRTSRFPAASRPPTGVLPRKRAASSATGGAWPA